MTRSEDGRTGAGARTRTVGGDGARDDAVIDVPAGRPALESRRRRAVVDELAAAETIDVRTLANRVAAREYDPTAESTAFRQRQRVLVSLRRTHLPALESADVLGYDRANGAVSPGPNLVETTAELVDEKGYDPDRSDGDHRFDRRPDERMGDSGSTASPSAPSNG